MSSHGPKGQTRAMAQLAAAAATLPVPGRAAAEGRRSDSSLIGKPSRASTSPDKVDGNATVRHRRQACRHARRVMARSRRCSAARSGASTTPRPKVESRRERARRGAARTASRSWPTASGPRRRRPKRSRSSGTEGRARTSTMRRSWRCTARRSTGSRRSCARARRRRAGARGRREEDRRGIRGAVPRARHHGADERHRPGEGRRVRGLGADAGPGSARRQRWRRSPVPPEGSRSIRRSSAAASAGASSPTSCSMRRACPRPSAGR